MKEQYDDHNNIETKAQQIRWVWSFNNCDATCHKSSQRHAFVNISNLFCRTLVGDRVDTYRHHNW